MAYKTIFEEIQENTRGVKQSRAWYREQLAQVTSRNLIVDEQSDEVGDELIRDSNRVTSLPRLFNLHFYEYKARTRRNLPYYDKFPLAFVLDVNYDSFFAVNLHYYYPEERMSIAASLAENRIPRFAKGAHKYLLSEVRSPYLNLAEQEWQTICLLPVEQFVRDLGGVEIPISSEKVWSK